MNETAGAHPAAKIGFSNDDIVMEIGWDDDVDESWRGAIEALAGSPIEDETYDGVVDSVVLWFRDGDGDLTDDIVDALATLARRAQAEGVGELVDGRAADLDRLADAITPGSAEVVLCHRILEYVDSPAATLAAATSALAPGGIMSIVVANRPGAVLSRVIAGRFDEAGSILDGASTPQAGARFTAAEITALLEDVGLRVQQVRGVGLIGELNPSASFSVQAKALADRLASDATLAQAAPLLHIIAGRSEHGA